MVIDADPRKTSLKRRPSEETQSDSKAKTSKKPDTAPTSQPEQSAEEVSAYSGSDEMESQPSAQPDRESGYSLTRIRKFLQDSKGKRAVKAESFFTDLKCFVDSAKMLMKKPAALGEEAFTDREVFRLKKIVQKIGDISIPTNVSSLRSTHCFCFSFEELSRLY